MQVFLMTGPGGNTGIKGFRPFSSTYVSMDEVLQVHQKGQSFADEESTSEGGSRAGGLAKPQIPCDTSVK